MTSLHPKDSDEHPAPITESVPVANPQTESIATESSKLSQENEDLIMLFIE